MLSRLAESELNQHADFFWCLAQNNAASGYPTYNDGISTCEEFMQKIRRAMAREHGEVLLWHMDGEVRGLVAYYTLPEDQYAQTEFFLAQDGAPLVQELTAYMQARFAGYEFDMGFPAENTTAIAAAECLGFRLLEESINTNMTLAAWETAAELPEIVPVTEDNYDDFRALHDAQEMYWNSARILRDISRWRIHMLPGCGAIYFITVENAAEVFGMDGSATENEADFRALVTASLNRAKAEGIDYLTFFVDDEQTAVWLRKMGFRIVGCYKGYQKIL